METQMKKYLAIFTCAENSENHLAWKRLSVDERNDRIQKGEVAKARWQAAFGKQVVLEISSLGEKTKRVNSSGVHEIASQMGAFAVVLAPSHDEAAKMFLDHPHFALFPGDGVEVLELTESRG